MKRCITCGKNAREFVLFPCPGCGTELTRCSFCRENRNPFKCTCGFEGP
jgi:hypothetical protein